MSFFHARFYQFPTFQAPSISRAGSIYRRRSVENAVPNVAYLIGLLLLGKHRQYTRRGILTM